MRIPAFYGWRRFNSSFSGVLLLLKELCDLARFDSRSGVFLHPQSAFMKIPQTARKYREQAVYAVILIEDLRIAVSRFLRRMKLLLSSERLVVYFCLPCLGL
jgi:hypothetical protein